MTGVFGVVLGQILLMFLYLIIKGGMQRAD